MATSGTLQLNPNTYTTDGAPNRADINWSATWNSSTLQWSVSWNAVAAGNTNSYWVTIFSGTVTFTDANGNVLDTKSMAAQVPKARGGDQLLSGSFVVGVDSLGNQTLNISGRFQIEFNGSGSDNAGTSKGTGSYALDQMAMASTFTVTSSTVGASGGASTVSISRRSPSYTHSVTWTFGSYTHTETGVGTSVTYTIPASWLNAIPSSPTGVGSVTVQTYNGSTPIGSAATAQFSVTAAVYPSIGSFTSAPRGAAYTAQITNYTTTYVSGYSTALLTASSVAGAYGSSIKRYDFYQSGALIAQASSSASSYSYETVNPVSGSEIQFTVVVTDTRDRQTSANVSISLRPYAVPSYTETTVYRCNQSGTATNDGTYVFIRASAYATPTENSITSLSFAVKTTSSSTYGSEIALTNGTYNISSGYANTSSYDIRLTATDKLGQTSYKYFTIPTAEYTMDFKVGGNGVAFGKVAETANLVDSAWGFRSTGTGTLYDAENSTANTDTRIRVKRTDTNRDIELLVGQGGTNRGLYVNDGNMNGWLVYYDDADLNISKVIKINSNGGTLSIGAVNTGWYHFMGSPARAFYFDNQISTQGNIAPYFNNQFTLGDANHAWSVVYGVNFTGTAASANTAWGVSQSDNRDTNQAPSWYFSNYAYKAISEFKTSSVIGLNSGHYYANLITETPWGDSSGGYPVQYATSNGHLYKRVATSNSAWGAWGRVDSSSVLLASSVGSTEVTITSAASYYSAFIIVGTPSTNYQASCYIPKAALSSTATKWQLADEARYIGCDVRLNGDTLYAKVSGSTTSGKTVAVYGISGS